MVIEIDEAQRSLLHDLVDTRLTNLSSEIRHTDSAPLRQALRDERVSLRVLVGLLGPARKVAGA